MCHYDYSELPKPYPGLNNHSLLSHRLNSARPNLGRPAEKSDLKGLWVATQLMLARRRQCLMGASSRVKERWCHDISTWPNTSCLTQKRSWSEHVLDWWLCLAHTANRHGFGGRGKPCRNSSPKRKEKRRLKDAMNIFYFFYFLFSIFYILFSTF